MTVKELKEKLEEYDENMNAFICTQMDVIYPAEEVDTEDHDGVIVLVIS